ncbi:polyamine ABC transporter substrate-binding protein [Micromonospora rosaria]|uniref:polyamine ABC transporter substrate-binding protein n=1 Tax=Micromonospora rosaria TaxID=47874 RepID=UPI001FE0EAD4|nr:spermidine/putrescine ABC transporter substrate-binding protein [Micromonospora rosaria]
MITGVLGSALVAAGCGVEGARQDPQDCVTEDRSASEPTLAFSNWPQYLDVDEDDPTKRPTLDDFVARTGIRVTYTEDINDNNEFFGKVRQQLAACRGIDRDLIVLTDWLAARMIGFGWIQQLDPARLPNVRANLLPQLANRSFDPDGRIAVPWQSGLAGLAYNGRVTREVRTVDELLTRPDLKGRVTLLSEMRDTMGLLLQSAGHDPANFTDDQFDAALARLERAVAAGQIRRFTGNDYAPELARGDIAACLAWSGDAIQLAAGDERVRFVAPEEGVLLFSDNLLVPKTATHRANAERLIDHYYDPAVAARLAAYVNYICPVRGAREEMERIDPELAANPLIFPDDALLNRARVFMTLDEEQERRYETAFQRVIGA